MVKTAVMTCDINMAFFRSLSPNDCLTFFSMW